MHPADLLQLSRISLNDDAVSKKRVLEKAATLLSDGDDEEPTTEQIFERLLERERLGSTGLAGGVALPHARMAGVEEPRGAFLRMATAVEFDAMDDQPVDLAFALLVPEEATDEHLQLLAQLAHQFGDAGLCQQLRETPDPAAVPRILKGDPQGKTGDPEGEPPDDAPSDPSPGSVRLPA